MRTRGATWALSMIFTLIGARADARPLLGRRGAEAELSLSPCSVFPFDRDVLSALVSAELGVAPAAQSSETAQRAASIHVRIETACDPDAPEAAVDVEDADSKTHVRRLVALDSVSPKTRERLIALHVAEILHLLRAEPPAGASEDVRGAKPAHSTLDLEPAKDAAGRGEGGGHSFVATGVEVRSSPALGTVFAGPTVLASFALSKTIPLRADTAMALLFASDHDVDGSVDWTLATGSLGVSLAGGGEVVDFAVGPRLDAGVVLANPHATVAAVHTSVAREPVLATMMAARATIHVATLWWIYASVSAGSTWIGFEGRSSGRTVGGVGQATLGSSLGLAASW